VRCRGRRLGAVGILALSAHSLLIAQNKGGAKSSQNTISIPTVGCKADGQAGPVDAPDVPKTTTVNADPASVQKLAYYTSGGVGVLGPRGWFCFEVYGSNGGTLLVGPQTLDLSSDTDFTGPGIAFSYWDGQSSGRFEVAEVIARVFPAHKAFATGVSEGFGTTFSFGPFPKDKLTYKGGNVVEFQTPSQTDGLGTYQSFKKNDTRIDGVAILVGPTPNLRFLSVRLPTDLAALTRVIVQQAERDSKALDY